MNFLTHRFFLHQQLQEVVETLKDTQQQILQQERLKALGQMASGITHDFNNALTPILGYASLVVKKGSKQRLRTSSVMPVPVSPIRSAT